MRPVLLVDADSEAFAASVVCDKKQYIGVRSVPGPLAGRILGPFDGKKKLNAAIPAGEAVEAFENVTTLPVEAALEFVDARIRRLVAHAEERYGSVELELWLSGPANFRFLIDPTYKWSRERVLKPYHLHATRQHLRSKWGAGVAIGWEADDEIGIRHAELIAQGRDVVIASVDKDLRQIPGRHIVTGKGHLQVSERGALMRFYSQLLGGDPTDNIRGCYMTSAEGAFTELEPLADQGELALWNKCLEVYTESLAKYGRDECGYTDARGAALNTANLVRILRERPKGYIPDRWVPPDRRS